MRIRLAHPKEAFQPVKVCLDQSGPMVRSLISHVLPALIMPGSDWPAAGNRDFCEYEIPTTHDHLLLNVRSVSVSSAHAYLIAAN